METNYTVKDNEKNVYHVKLIRKRFDETTQQLFEDSRIVKTPARTIEMMLDGFKKQGFIVEVVYNPTEWLNENGGKTPEQIQLQKLAKERAELSKERAEMQKELAEMRAMREQMKKELTDQGKGHQGRPKKDAQG